jgi:hypothetical protein
MRTSFEQLYPLMSPYGVYAVEDLHACYSEKYGGGYKAPNSFWEFVKDKIDELNAGRTQGAITSTAFTRSTKAIHIYKSIVVFDRAPHKRSISTRVGGSGRDDTA